MRNINKIEYDCFEVSYSSMDTISIRQSLLRLTPIGFRKIKKIKAPVTFEKSFLRSP
jgi:hypothetical protein